MSLWLYLEASKLTRNALAIKPKPFEPMLAAWFDRFVKAKMAAIAIPSSGIGISCFLLTFAQIFSGFTFNCVTGVGIILLVASCGLFIYASVRLVMVSFEDTRSGKKPTKPEP